MWRQRSSLGQVTFDTDFGMRQHVLVSKIEIDKILKLYYRNPVKASNNKVSV